MSSSSATTSTKAAEASPRPQIQSPIQANELKPPKTNNNNSLQKSNPYLYKNSNTQQGSSTTTTVSKNPIHISVKIASKLEEI